MWCVCLVGVVSSDIWWTDSACFLRGVEAVGVEISRIGLPLLADQNAEDEKPKRVQRERRTIRGKQDENNGPQGKKP
jgi:hypothetical protein